MDPVIPADILDALWVVLAIVGVGMMAYGGLGLLGIEIALKRERIAAKRARLIEQRPGPGEFPGPGN